jgi:hypothetical protein
LECPKVKGFPCSEAFLIIITVTQITGCKDRSSEWKFAMMSKLIEIQKAIEQLAAEERKKLR